MSEMTEARLKYIEEVARDYNKISGNAARELTAEVRRLRECIANAPHGEFCASRGKDPQYPKIPVACDCLKREALGGGE